MSPAITSFFRRPTLEQPGGTAQTEQLRAAELTTNLQDAGVTALVADSAHHRPRQEVHARPAADPAQTHAAVEKHGVTIVMVVPGISGPFVTHPDPALAGETTLCLLVSAAVDAAEALRIELERELWIDLIPDGDLQEGAAAFFDGRDPVYPN